MRNISEKIRAKNNNLKTYINSYFKNDVNKESLPQLMNSVDLILNTLIDNLESIDLEEQEDQEELDDLINKLYNITR